MKKLFFLVLFFIFSSFIFANNYIIEDNNVYINDSNVFINANPHTLFGSGFVNYKLLSKSFNGDINMILGTNTEFMNPKYLEVKSYSNITIYDYGDNSYKIIEKEVWNKVNKDFSTFYYNYNGKNKWFFIKDIPINSNKMIEFRIYYEIPLLNKNINSNIYDTKYDIGFFPSFYGYSKASLINSIINNHFYFLDPWGKGTDGLLNYFTMDDNETSGTTSIGYNNSGNLTISGAVTGVSGIINSSYYYDTNSDYSQASNSILSIGNKTVNLWVKFIGSNGKNWDFISANAQGLASNMNGFTMYRTDATNKITVTIGNGAGTGEFLSCDTSGTISDTNWHMITMVQDTNQLFVYLDNNSANGCTNTTSSGNETSPSNNFQLGDRPLLGGYGLIGYIDEVALLNRAIDSSEIGFLYSSGAPTELQQAPFQQSSAPIINLSSLNCTNCYANNSDWRTNINLTAFTKNNTPIITFNTDVNSNCSISTINLNYTAMIIDDSNSKCESSLTTSHNCTLPISKKLIAGNNSLYISCIDSTGLLNENSSSGALNISMDYLFNFLEVYALDSNNSKVSNFNSSNVPVIERAIFNFSIDTTSYFDIFFNFTADGLNGCSLGNLQNDFCYNYDNDTYKWIEFKNGSLTDTFDDRTSSSGESIDYSVTTNATHSIISFNLDEHYNPNVFKLYNAQFNFSDVKWQDGLNQRITKNNYFLVRENNTLIPGDADLYKLDIRVNYTPGVLIPTQPIEAYLCNSSYVNGDFSLEPSCVLVGQKLPGELTDDGTKFRSLFTNTLVQELGDISVLGLKTDEINIAKYYTVKTYKIRNVNHTQKWEYSTDSGTSWSNLGDGYETEANINWFNDGADPTTFQFSVYVNNSVSRATLTGNYTWDITASTNYPPLVNIENPSPNETIKLPYNITFFSVDTNNDALNISLLLYENDIFLKNIVTDMNASNTSYYYIDYLNTSNYTIVLSACELNSTEFLCVNDSHDIIIQEKEASISYTGDSLSFSVLPTDIFNKSFVLNNSGDWNATNCNISFIGSDIANFTSFNVSNGFNINFNNTLSVLTNFTNITEASYTGNLVLNCSSGSQNNNTKDFVLSSYSITSASTPVTPPSGGGGGGSSVTIPLSISNFSIVSGNKIDCNFILTPEIIIIDDDNLNVSFILQNNNNISTHISLDTIKSPGFNESIGSFKFDDKSFVIGANDEIKNKIFFIKPAFGYDTISTEMLIELSSNECNNVLIPFEIRLSEDKSLMFGISNIFAWFFDPVLDGGSLLLNIYVFGICYLIFFLLFLKAISKSFQKKKSNLIWIFVILLLLASITNFIVLILLEAFI